MTVLVDNTFSRVNQAAQREISAGQKRLVRAEEVARAAKTHLVKRRSFISTFSTPHRVSYLPAPLAMQERRRWWQLV